MTQKRANPPQTDPNIRGICRPMRRNEAYMTNQELNTHQIKVIGHCNPDTDSICSAIAYSRLKNMIDPDHPCKPCRAGLLNRETEFVLNYFNVPDRKSVV